LEKRVGLRVTALGHTEIRALEARLALLDPDPAKNNPRMEDIAPESIREARNALNLTEEQTARRLGVSCSP
jgi:DNA-binding transcriptional regulator YiaG